MKNRLILCLLLLSVNAANGQLIGAGRRGLSSSGSITETDPTVPTAVKSITTTNISNWNAVSSASGNYVTLSGIQSLSNKTFTNSASFIDTWANGQLSLGSINQAAKLTLVNGNNGTGGLTLGYTGAVTPTAEINSTVSGGFNVRASNASSGLVAISGLGTTSGGVTITTAGGEVLRAFPSGNIGIGTNTDGSFKTDINGTARISGTVTLNNGIVNSAGTGNTNVGSVSSTFGSIYGIRFLSNGAGAWGTESPTGSLAIRQGTAAGNSVQYFQGTTGNAWFKSPSITLSPTENFAGVTINHNTTANTRGLYVNSTLTATVDGDILRGVDIAPSFINGSFSNVTNEALRVGGATNITGSLTLGGILSTSSIISPTSSGVVDIGSNSFNWRAIFAQTFVSGSAAQFGTTSTSQLLSFRQGSSTQLIGGFHPTTGNLAIQPAGGSLATDDLVNRVQISGSVKASQYRLSALNTAPASATDAGTIGEIRITSAFIFVCVATNTWVRAPLNTWP